MTKNCLAIRVSVRFGSPLLYEILNCSSDFLICKITKNQSIFFLSGFKLGFMSLIVYTYSTSENFIRIMIIKNSTFSFFLACEL